MKNALRIISFIAAIWLACYGHDTQQMMLWGIGIMYAVLFALAQLLPKEKRHGGNRDANGGLTPKIKD